MNKKIYQIAMSGLLLTLLSAFTQYRGPSSSKNMPNPAELRKLGAQMASTVIRGVAWPTKNTVKGCWREDELPNINIDAEIEVNPDYDSIEPTYLKMDRVVIQSLPQKTLEDYGYAESGKDRRFVYEFYLRKPLSKKKLKSKKSQSLGFLRP